jgi:hypothetical protein
MAEIFKHHDSKVNWKEFLLSIGAFAGGAVALTSPELGILQPVLGLGLMAAGLIGMTHLSKERDLR